MHELCSVFGTLGAGPRTSKAITTVMGLAIGKGLGFLLASKRTNET